MLLGLKPHSPSGGDATVLRVSMNIIKELLCYDKFFLITPLSSFIIIEIHIYGLLDWFNEQVLYSFYRFISVNLTTTNNPTIRQRWHRFTCKTSKRQICKYISISVDLLWSINMYMSLIIFKLLVVSVTTDFLQD